MNSILHPLPKLSTQVRYFCHSNPFYYMLRILIRNQSHVLQTYNAGSRPTVPFNLKSPHRHRHSFSAAPQRLQLTTRCEAPSSNSSSSSPQLASLKSQGWLVSTPESNSVRQDYDAILVLGGGLTPTGDLPPWVVRRLDGAHYIYSQQTNPTPIVLLGAGTPHKRPVLDPAGFVLHESTAYARYLLEEYSLPAKELLKETSSYDTVGNAYFGLTMHALPAGWRKLSIVTSAFHMPRTQAIFKSCFEIASRDTLGNSAPFQLDFHPVSDEGLFSQEVITARKVKESAAVMTWQNNVAHVPLNTLADLHRWLFATHLCYSVSKQHEFGVKDDMDPTLAATY